jgi:uncharacterized damage-inducible protein DinB
MITKQGLLQLLQKEGDTTIKMMRAFPGGKTDFKPHERSSEAIKLGRTFVFEMYLMESYLFGDKVDRSVFQNYNPQSFEAVIADFEQELAKVKQRMEALPDADLEKTIEFGGAKFAGDEFALMMIHDQIHHRGQLSVYVRMAGGKVPSIYGPSADDESTNL